ncbi:MAG TPA: hypothetical protein VKS79_03320 [Gemmataceae bacterium]|nr:hypothetical protein [Gemmataceae bacterium]
MKSVTRRDALKFAAIGTIVSYAGTGRAQEKKKPLPGEKSDDQVKVKSADFESLGKKLEAFHSKLTEGEANIFEFLIENAAAAASLTPPPKWFTVRPHFKFKPRGAKHLVSGGADGLTILITGRGKIIVVPPEGPLPTEVPTDVLGAVRIQG